MLERLGKAGQLLPEKVQRVVSGSLQSALQAASWAAYSTQPARRGKWHGHLTGWTNGKWFHRVSTTLSGGITGAFGGPGALVDIPISTILVLRSLQSIAFQYGRSPDDPSVRMECVALLGIGGPLAEDDQLEGSFWSARAAVVFLSTEQKVLELLSGPTVTAIATSEAFSQLMRTPALQGVINRFALTTQASIAKKAVPVIGAGLGAFVNYNFMSYYEAMAHVHYRLRRLEESYDQDQLRSCFLRLVEHRRQ